MKPSLLLGFSLILVSAVASGVFGIALRRRRVFSVELMWLIIFLTGYAMGRRCGLCQPDRGQVRPFLASESRSNGLQRLRF